MKKSLSLAVFPLFLTFPSLSWTQPARPDLVVDAQALAGSVSLQPAYFLSGDCGVAHGCLVGTGSRELLIFETVVGNIGSGDLALGNPITSPFYTLSTCNGSRLLNDFLLIELLGAGGSVVVSNARRPTCVDDAMAYVGEPWVPPSPAYTCQNQGIQRGWASALDVSQPCEWLDVTGLPAGSYTLKVTVNPSRAFQEAHYNNNVAAIPVSIPASLPQPDLIFDLTSLQDNPIMTNRYFAPDSHEVEEACIGAPGYRDLLRFTTQTANISQTDFVLGEPGVDPRWEWSPAHGHYHLKDFSNYELLDLQGNVVAPGHKQGWFPASTDQYVFEPWVPASPYNTSVYGIARGWSDVYAKGIPCQWIDVTGLPPGSYRLRTTVNPTGLYPESNYANNTTVRNVGVLPLAGIPHRPDGSRVPGQPLIVAHDGPNLRVTYDVAFCPPGAYNLYYGLGQAFAYRYDGALCDIGSSGTVTVAIPDPAPGQLAWFTIVGAGDPNSSARFLEGGHGFDSSGRPRPLTGAPFCGITASQSVELCGNPGPQ